MFNEAGATHTHSSNSASLMTFQEDSDNRGYLVPTGKLIESGIAPMSGTLDPGVFTAFGRGINMEHLSMSFIPYMECNPKQLVTDYSNIEDIEDIDYIENYTHQMLDKIIRKFQKDVEKEKEEGNVINLENFFKKLKDRFHYEQEHNLPSFSRVLTRKIMRNTAYIPLEKLEEFLDKAIKIADLRIKQYNTMSDVMKQFVDEPFPVTYGIKPTKSRTVIRGPCHTSREYADKDGIGPGEIRVILVPEEKVNTVKNFIGEDFLKEKIIKIRSIEQAFPDKK